MDNKRRIEQLEADLASENEALTLLIEQQEQFLIFLENIRRECKESAETLLDEIIDRFKGIIA